MPRRFLYPVEIGEARTSVRVTRTILMQQKSPPSLNEVHVAMHHLLDAMEASVELIEAAQEAVYKSWEAYHLLDARVKQAAAEEEEGAKLPDDQRS